VPLIVRRGGFAAAGGLGCERSAELTPRTPSPPPPLPADPPRNPQLKAFVESGEGTAVILLCTVESNPPAELTLLKGGQPVASRPPPAGDHPGQPPNALRLELREASEEDEGEYECWARSPLGSTHASLSLTVQGESGFAVGGGTRGWGPPGRVMWACRVSLASPWVGGHGAGDPRVGWGGCAGVQGESGFAVGGGTWGWGPPGGVVWPCRGAM